MILKINITRQCNNNPLYGFSQSMDSTAKSKATIIFDKRNAKRFFFIIGGFFNSYL